MVSKAILAPFLLSVVWAQIGFSNNPTCLADNTITVYGSADVTATPDSASIAVSIQVSAATTNSALSSLAVKINAITNALVANGLNSTNWVVTNLDVYPNSSYLDGNEVVYGQIASESLNVNIPLPNTHLGTIFDDLAAVDGISVNGLTYNLINQTNYLIAARQLAYKDAAQRAQDYACAASLTLGSAVTITDSYSVAPSLTSSPLPLEALAKVLTPTTVTVGTVTVSYDVSVVFSFTG